MKKLRTVVVFAGFCALLSLLPAFAQETLGPITFTAPTAFYVQNTKLPAGSYTISQPGVLGNALLLQSNKTDHQVFIDVDQATAASPYAATQVTFNKYGNNDFLSGIQVGGSKTGWRVLPTSWEKAQSGSAAPHSMPAKSAKK